MSANGVAEKTAVSNKNGVSKQKQQEHVKCQSPTIENCGLEL